MGDDIFPGGLSWEAVFAPTEEVLRREIAGETLLVPIRGRIADMKRIFAVNPVAGFIWQQLDGSANLKQIRERVVERFDIGRDAAGKDMLAFFEELATLGLVALKQ